MVDLLWVIRNINLECWLLGEIHFGTVGGKGLDEWERMCVLHLIVFIVNDNSNLSSKIEEFMVFSPQNIPYFNLYDFNNGRICGNLKRAVLELLADLQTERRPHIHRWTAQFRSNDKTIKPFISWLTHSLTGIVWHYSNPKALWHGNNNKAT